MLSPQECRLLATIFLVLALGAFVKSCRNHVTVSEIPKSKDGVLESIAPANDGRD